MLVSLARPIIRTGKKGSGQTPMIIDSIGYSIYAMIDLFC